jgi:hypothetical protein
MRIKWRISIWLIIAAIGIPLALAAFNQQWEITLGLAGILGTLASKLVESEEKS